MAVDGCVLCYWSALASFVHILQIYCFIVYFNSFQPLQIFRFMIYFNFIMHVTDFRFHLFKTWIPNCYISILFYIFLPCSISTIPFSTLLYVVCFMCFGFQDIVSVFPISKTMLCANIPLFRKGLRYTDWLQRSSIYCIYFICLSLCLYVCQHPCSMGLNREIKKEYNSYETR